MTFRSAKNGNVFLYTRYMIYKQPSEGMYTFSFY